MSWIPKVENRTVFLVLAWLLTLELNGLLLMWTGIILQQTGIISPGANVMALGISIESFLHLLAIGFALLALTDKNLRVLSIIAISVNGLLLINKLTLFLMQASNVL